MAAAGGAEAGPDDVRALAVTAERDAGLGPIGRASSVLGDRWVILILRDATIGITRFDAFRDHLGIAENILSARLRRLVDEGLLVKVPYHDGRRARHEYRLTQAGADLAPILRALGDWGHQHTKAATPTEPMRIIHDGCGGDVGVDQVCSSCGTVVGRDQLAWIRPWHSPEPVRLAQPVP
jgi:DNA-binding HxlR family transcriptional regulator